MYQPDFPPSPFRLGFTRWWTAWRGLRACWRQAFVPIQLRIKDKRDEEVEADVIAAIALGRRYHARLFINDYWRLAVKHQAYGVHLGQEDLETTDLNAIRDAGLRLGVSTHMMIWRSMWRWQPALLHRARSRFPDANQTDAVRSTGLDAAGGPR